eukprot:TRINITY_DN2879_c0_g2_i10.p1 TRINITY_DN2879_c0_g2~~TRINITY_DN2879_c0_g2_i10.p1  ORF type:complete len:401 (+),score=113.65 TRINITY_DN2879_c0_g2_i10:103-1305(+)
MYKIFVIFVILWQVHGWFEGTGAEDFDSPVEHGTFDNLLDHFDPSNTETFKQRYWPGNFMGKNDKPVFIYICAEAKGSYVKPNSFIMKIAEKVGGSVVSLEHRFYGESFPQGEELTLKNLEYLSHDQALADVAYFIGFLKEEKGLGNSKVFTVGGSYAGALSAWMRYKYPHLVAGALSSSGVVNAVLDFYQFDEHVKNVVANRTKDCETTIRKVISEAESLWKINPWIIRNAHKAPYFEWEDFEFYYSDIFVETVQYGRGSHLCQYMDKIKFDKNRQEKLAELALNNRAQPHKYAFQYIRSTYHNPMHSYRQWTYQFCSALAYFNSVGPLKDPLRFKNMNLAYWRSYCMKSFGTEIFPNTNHTNALYGDVRIKDVASRIIFTNARDDPWQWAGVREYFKQ